MGSKKRGQFVACLICGREFWKEPRQTKKYCSYACMGVATSIRLKGKPAPWVGDQKKSRICVICGKRFQVYPAWMRKCGSRGMCCSRSCGDIWHSRALRKPVTMAGIMVRCLEVAAGLSPDGYSGQYFRIRPEIYKRDNGKCQLCGKRGRACHHIDYDRLNNDPQNLIVLCGHCHVLTNYRRAFWQEHLSSLAASRQTGRVRGDTWTSEQTAFN